MATNAVTIRKSKGKLDSFGIFVDRLRNHPDSGGDSDDSLQRCCHCNVRSAPRAGLRGFAAHDAFPLFYAVAIIVTAFAGILAGLALLGGRSWARALALVASFLSVSDLPLGTTLGIYTLIVFLP